MEQLFKKIGLILFFSLGILLMRRGLRSGPGLVGAIDEPTKVELTITNWFNGSFQDYFNNNVELLHFYRHTLVRINNEIELQIFNKCSENNGIKGKNGYFFQKDAWESLYKPCRKEEEIKNHIKQLSQLQSQLNSEGKNLLYVIPASKTLSCNKYLKSPFLPRELNSPNIYDLYIKYLRLYEIQHIDFQKWFSENQDLYQHPLFPKNGAHWSTYCSGIALDSIINRFEKINNRKYARVSYDSVINSTELKNPEGDLLWTLNLLIPPNTDTLAYPVYKKDPNNKTRLNLLAISDSYFNNFTYSEMMSLYLDPKSKYWYYGKSNYNNKSEWINDVTKEDYKEAFKEHDNILIMSCSQKLKTYSFGLFNKMDPSPKN